MLVEPSKVVDPVTSPVSSIVLAVASLVAVAALPNISPANLPSASLTGTVLAVAVLEGL